MIYVQSKVAAGILTVESDEVLKSPEITDLSGKKVSAPLLGSKTEGDKQLLTFDASGLKCWSPDSPVLYLLKAEGVSQRFGFCELRTSVLENVRSSQNPNRWETANGSICAAISAGSRRTNTRT